MLFRRSLIVESKLSVAATRARLRGCATSPYVADLAAFRRRQIIGWRLSESNESFLFEPEYGDRLDIEGARFVGLVEPVETGARIRGLVMVSALAKLMLSLWMLTVVAATVAVLGQGSEPPARVLATSGLLCSVTVVLVRYSLRLKSRVVEGRLRQGLEAVAAEAAA